MTSERSPAEQELVIIASRASLLAMHQTGLMADRLRKLHPGVTFEIKVVKTEADSRPEVPLQAISGEGIFVKELEKSLLAKESDLAVHSLKDMPTAIAAGLTLAAIPEREDPRDVLITRDGKGLDSLPRGARLGSASPRRQVQLKAWRPDIELIPIRGNIDTRLRKLQEGEFDAILLAAAALNRLGWQDRIAEFLPLDKCLPAPGQGALALEARQDDRRTLELAGVIDHPETRRAVTAERAFLAALGGGCRAPIAAHGSTRGQELELDGMASNPGGSKMLRERLRGPLSEPEKLGADLGRLLLDKGAKAFMPAGQA